MTNQADKLWIESKWMGKNVRQNDGISHLIGRMGKVVETFWDEKGALHCKVSGGPYGLFWCPADLLEFS